MSRHASIRQRSLQWPLHTLSLLCYLVGSLLATWPLAAHITTHVTGDGIDDPALAWNLWWIKYRLVDLVQPDIFHVGWMFHPIDINLGFYTLTPLNGLLSVPLQTATTLLLANNLLLLFSFVLGGYGMFLLTQTVWAHHFARMDARLAWGIAWLAGAFYTFAGAKLFYASLGQFNIASSHWLPFCALYVWRTLHATTPRAALRNGTLAGIFLVFQTWSELTYATFLLLFFALAYLWFCITWLTARSRQTSSRQIMPQTERHRGGWMHVTLGMAAAALTFAIGLAPFLAAILPDMRLEGDFFASGGGFADQYSADLMGYLLPTRLHPWLGSWVATLPFPNDKGQQIYLGYTLMILLVLGASVGLRVRKSRGITGFWLLAFTFFWLLTLGPRVRWAGQEGAIPGPFALVNQLPFFNGNRYPSRYSVMLLLCAAPLAANGLIWLTTQLQWKARGNSRLIPITLVIIACLFTIEHISTPLPLSDFRVPPIYQRIAQEPGDFALLELPTGWRNGARVLGKSDVLIMMQQWYQTAHTKRRLGGNTSRNPEYKFQYFSESPLLSDLIALMNADRSHLAPPLEADYSAIADRARELAPDLFALLGVRFVTLHVEKSPALLVRLVEEALPLTLVEEWQGPDWTGAPSTIRLYAVNASPLREAHTVNFGDPTSQLYLAEGWSPAGSLEQGRYALRPTVDLLLPNRPNGAQVILNYSQESTITYAYQGDNLGTQSGTTHTLLLPASVEQSSPIRLTLAFESPPTPISTLVPDATPIGSTGISLDSGIAVLLQSAGEEVGDFAHIWINGVDYAKNTIGYNLVALAPTGEVFDQAVFNTMIPGESARMAAWLDQWQPGTIILGAGADSVADEYRMALDESATNALQRIGVAGDLRGKFRWSHVFAGVAGAPPASAPEEIQLTQPATLWLGTPLPAASGYGPLKSLGLIPNP